MRRLLINVALILCLVSCNNDAEKLAELEIQNKRFEVERSNRNEYFNSISNEIDRIYNVIDSINIEVIPDTISDLAFKISFMEQKFNESIVLVDSLEKRIVVNDDSYSIMAKLLSKAKKDLEDKESVILALKSQNNLLVDSLEYYSETNNELVEEVKDLSELKESLVLEIETIREERRVLKENANQKDKKIDELVTSLSESSNDVGLSYYEIATELMQKFEQIKGPFQKKKKVEYINLAYKNFRLSCQKGYVKSQEKLKIILLTDKYSKFLQLDRDISNSSFGVCGI